MLAGNWGFISGIVFVLIAGYSLLQMGDGALLARPDVAAHKEAAAKIHAQNTALVEARRLALEVLQEGATDGQ